MTHADLLIEIGTEELPPRSLRSLSNSFRANVDERLSALNLEHGEVRSYATPRRLALIVERLSPTQPDQESTRRGPALGVAFDKDGKPTRAALGFAASNGVDVSALEELRTDKGAWLSCTVTVKGRPLQELLPEVLDGALMALPVAKRMRWGASRTEFVRPVHWVTLLHGSETVECSVLGLRADRLSYGHRFMAPAAIRLDAVGDYLDALRGAHVVADFGERMEIIRSGLLATAEDLRGDAVVDEDLLEEVAALVEWPVVLAGSFEPEFLDTPKEVLISAMKKHQRYFHVTDSNGALVSSFLVVANIESRDPAQVIAGNEKVIRPRLADAAFFYNLDCRTTLESKLDRLKGVVFQARLGSYFDKATRVARLSAYLAKSLDCDPSHAERAGFLCKADLASNLVNEFPDLQGVMGAYYAANDKEEAQVSVAIGEQYLPAFSGDALPSSRLGRVVSLADKLDTLVGLFGIDEPPTGSRDPFGLRRAAIGILRIIIEAGLEMDLRAALEHAASLYAPQRFSVEPLLDYILDRLNFWHQEQGTSPEVFSAVKNCTPVVRKEPLSLVDLDQRMRAVSSFRGAAAAAALSEANKRVSNILLKQAADHRQETVDAGRLKEPAERELHAAIERKRQEIAPLVASGDYRKALELLSELQGAIDRFFDEVLVMDQDPAVRTNRISLLASLRGEFLRIADLSYLHSA